jgi:hypothetical protein
VPWSGGTDTHGKTNRCACTTTKCKCALNHRWSICS